MRRFLVVGDPPAAGGRFLPYHGPMVDFFGHQAALIGGRAYCEGCNSVGIIAKAGGPRRQQFISVANWFVEQRNPNRATGGVYRADIYAQAIKGDAASLKKAKLRLAEIAGLLNILGTTTSVEVHEHIEENASKATRHPEHLDILNATVQPACAKTVSCCRWSEGPAAPPTQQ